MTEWIDFSVYALLIVALWFVWPTWSDRFTAAIVRDRNPEWAATHQETVSRLERVWNPWAYYVWGAVSLSLLLAFQVGASRMGLIGAEHTPKWEALKDLNSTLLLPGLLYFVVTGSLFKRSLRRLVPLAERRRASLEPRTLDDFVPRGLQIAAYALAGGVLAAWLVVGILQLYSSSIFWLRFLFFAALTPAIAFVVRFGVHRRPGTLDRILGPGFRAREIRYGFIAHVVPPVVGAVRLYEEVTATPMMDVLRVLHLLVPAFIVLWVFSLSSRARRISVAACTVLALVLAVPAAVVAQRAAAVGTTMVTVAAVLSLPPARALLGTITQDRTGLTDRYTMELDYAFPSSPSAAPPEFAAPSLPTAVREQWGLRLVPSKGPLKAIIVESAQLPTAN